MSENMAIFILGIVLTVLMGIIAFLLKLVLNNILTEVKDIRRDLNHVNESQVKTRAVLQNLPCRNEPAFAKHCQAARG